MASSSLDSILQELLSESELEQLEPSKTVKIASLWSDYGACYRLTFQDNSTRILKLISPPSPSTNDPSSTNESDLRKRLSYKVESNFYRLYSTSLEGVPKYFNSISSDPLASQSSQALLLSDLVTDGYPKVGASRSLLNPTETSTALKWLASFHAHFFGQHSDGNQHCPPPLKATEKAWNGDGVWKIGGYSYLQTRLQEFSSISSSSEFSILGPSSSFSFAIEHLLQSSPPSKTTLLHGDVKSANMAFSKSGEKVALYDFQYVGKGLGAQDLAKFLTTSVETSLLEGDGGETDLLREYHNCFLKKLVEAGKCKDEKQANDAYSFEELQEDWKLAVLSWVRFQEGWGYWGSVKWIKRKARSILKGEDWKKEVLRKWEEAGSPTV